MSERSFSARCQRAICDNIDAGLRRDPRANRLLTAFRARDVDILPEYLLGGTAQRVLSAGLHERGGSGSSNDGSDPTVTLAAANALLSSLRNRGSEDSDAGLLSRANRKTVAAVHAVVNLLSTNSSATVSSDGIDVSVARDLPSAEPSLQHDVRLVADPDAVNDSYQAIRCDDEAEVAADALGPATRNVEHGGGGAEPRGGLLNAPPGTTGRRLPFPATAEEAGLNVGQFAVFSRLATWLQRPVAATDVPPVMLVHGPAGTGKSHVLGRLQHYMPADETLLVYTATTGVAATQLPSGTRTVHGCMKLDVNGRGSVAEVNLTHTKKAALLKNVPSTCRILVIDEVSMMTSDMLVAIDTSLRAIRPSHSRVPFGGIAIVLLGDFHQLPCIGKSLMDAALSRDNRDGQARELVRSIQVFSLTEQRRSAGDPAHTARVSSLRSLDSHPVTDTVTHALRPITAADVEDDPTWADPRHTRVLVGTNYARMYYNRVMASVFAKANNRYVFAWRNQFTPATLRLLGASASDEGVQSIAGDIAALYEEMTSYFVVGAPCMLMANVNPGKGLANGTAAVYHSLHLDDATAQYVQSELSKQLPFGSVILLPRPPIAINISLEKMNPGERDVPDHVRRALQPHSLVPGQLVLPVAPYCASRTRSAAVSSCSDPHLKNKLFYVKPAVDLLFASTVHKAQGQTLSKVIVDFTPGTGSKVTVALLYVAITRVTHGDNLRVFPGALSHLLSCSQSSTLRSWCAATAVGDDGCAPGSTFSVQRWTQFNLAQSTGRNSSRGRGGGLAARGRGSAAAAAGGGATRGGFGRATAAGIPGSGAATGGRAVAALPVPAAAAAPAAALVLHPHPPVTTRPPHPAIRGPVGDNGLLTFSNYYIPIIFAAMQLPHYLILSLRDRMGPPLFEWIVANYRHDFGRRAIPVAVLQQTQTGYMSAPYQSALLLPAHGDFADQWAQAKVSDTLAAVGMAPSTLPPHVYSVLFYWIQARNRQPSLWGQSSWIEVAQDWQHGSKEAVMALQVEGPVALQGPLINDADADDDQYHDDPEYLDAPSDADDLGSCDWPSD